MGNHTHNRAELLDALQLGLNILATILLVLGSVLGVSLFLAVVPVLVAATLELLTQMLGKDRRQGAETTGGLNVSYNTDDNHRRSLNDRDSIDDFTLVHERSSTVDTTDNVGHARLVSAKGGQVGLFIQIVMGKGANATRMVLGTLLGQETQTTVAGSFKLTVRPVLRGMRKMLVSGNAVNLKRDQYSVVRSLINVILSPLGLQCEGMSPWSRSDRESPRIGRG